MARVHPPPKPSALVDAAAQLLDAVSAPLLEPVEWGVSDEEWTSSPATLRTSVSSGASGTPPASGLSLGAAAHGLHFTCPKVALDCAEATGRSAIEGAYIEALGAAVRLSLHRFVRSAQCVDAGCAVAAASRALVARLGHVARCLRRGRFPSNVAAAAEKDGARVVCRACTPRLGAVPTVPCDAPCPLISPLRPPLESRACSGPIAIPRLAIPPPMYSHAKGPVYYVGKVAGGPRGSPTAAAAKRRATAAAAAPRGSQNNLRGVRGAARRFASRSPSPQRRAASPARPALKRAVSPLEHFARTTSGVGLNHTMSTESLRDEDPHEAELASLVATEMATRAMIAEESTAAWERGRKQRNVLFAHGGDAALVYFESAQHMDFFHVMPDAARMVTNPVPTITTPAEAALFQ